MDTRTRTRAIMPAATLAVVLVAAGCSATGTPQPTQDAQTPSSSPVESSPTAEPTDQPPVEAFAYPDPADPTQVAVYLKYEGSDPSGEIIAGPAVLSPDRPFSVEAQCEGDGASFEVVTADAERRVLAADDILCADPPAGQFTYQVPYTGPIQVNLIDADGVGRAWVRVVQP